tara:strand:+ start:586 stop:1074 length:489 start_codon:yes stop_codon:yes gene_type:complete
MVQEKKSSRMDPSMMACSKMVKNGVKAPINGRMSLYIQVTGLIIISKEKANTDGLMVGSTTDSGKKINCMVKAFTRGLTVGSMRENTKMIKSMAMEHITGRMVRHTKVSGSMESSMERQGSRIRKAEANLVYGKMANVSNGLMQKVQCVQEVKNLSTPPKAV